MKEINQYIIEKLHLDKNIHVGDVFQSHLRDAAQYLLEIFDEYIDYSTEEYDSFWESIKFETSLKDEDLKDISKRIGRDNILASHEWTYNENAKQLSVNIFKEPQLAVVFYTEKKIYKLILKNTARGYYKNYYAKSK